MEEESANSRPVKEGVMIVEVLDWAMNWDDDSRLFGKVGQ